MTIPKELSNLVAWIEEGEECPKELDAFGRTDHWRNHIFSHFQAIIAEIRDWKPTDPYESKTRDALIRCVTQWMKKGDFEFDVIAAINAND